MIDSYNIIAEFGNRIHNIQFSNDFKYFLSIRKDDSQNIIGKLIEVFWDDKTSSTWITIKKPYETELSKLKLENGESIIAHKTRTFRVW